MKNTANNTMYNVQEPHNHSVELYSTKLHLKFHYEAFYFHQYIHYIIQLIYKLTFFYTYYFYNSKTLIIM